MDAVFKLIEGSGYVNLTLGHIAMLAIAGVLIYLAIVKEYEPLLLIPIGFGVLMANLPGANMGSHDDGLMNLIYKMGIKTELMPPIIFMGVGVLTDFRPLLGRPITFLLGAAAQFGIFGALLGAYYLLGFTPHEAAAIGIIGGADGPTSIFLATKMAPHLLGPIAVAAYSYMSLVPIIQPPIMRLLTTQAEREINMPQARPVSKVAAVLFPIMTGALAILAVPSAGPLLGMLMFGNLLRECGVTDRLKQTAGGTLINIITIFLGLSVGGTMSAASFLTSKTLFILLLGLIAFVLGTAAGILFAKFINLFLSEKSKMNPCIGAAGVSAVPMSARVVQKFVSDSTAGRVNPLMNAMGPNVAGVIGSAVAAGALLALLGQPTALSPAASGEAQAAVAVDHAQPDDASAYPPGFRASKTQVQRPSLVPSPAQHHPKPDPDRVVSSGEQP
jgi:oxaloacetate decarboxylase beta subunit